MVKQVLAPGVEDGEESDAGSQMFGIGGDGEQGLGCGAEENAVNSLFFSQKRR